MGGGAGGVGRRGGAVSRESRGARGARGAPRAPPAPRSTPRICVRRPGRRRGRGVALAAAARPGARGAPAALRPPRPRLQPRRARDAPVKPPAGGGRQRTPCSPRGVSRDAEKRAVARSAHPAARHCPPASNTRRSGPCTRRARCAGWGCGRGAGGGEGAAAGQPLFGGAPAARAPRGGWPGPPAPTLSPSPPPPPGLLLDCEHAWGGVWRGVAAGGD